MKINLTKDDDIKLLLLKPGCQIKIDENVSFYPPTLEEISSIGYSKFLEKLNIIFIDLNKVKMSTADDERFDEFTPFQIFLLFASQQEDLGEKLLFLMQTLTKQEWKLENYLLHNDKIVFTEDHWDLLKQLCSIEFDIEYEKEDDYNFANEKAKEFKKRRREAEERVAKIKAKQNNKQTFDDLVSGLCAKHPNLDIFKVWDLSMYQFRNQLSRLNLIDDYKYKTSAILAGANPKKIKVQHWTTKI